jgi:AcrR family transcriptional regulator
MTPRNTNGGRGRTKGRAYRSPLRVEQAEQTRARILQAFGDEVCRSGNADVALRQVAARAGVSAPTLYRNFSTFDELADAYWEWVEAKFGSLSKVERPDDVPTFVEKLFIRFGELESLVTAMLLTRAGRKLRERGLVKRKQAIVQALSSLTRHLPEADAHAVAALFKVLVSGTAWYQLHQDWGLDGAAAGRVAAWALRALIEELRRNPNPLNKEK